jgi:hypothetical protein
VLISCFGRRRLDAWRKGYEVLGRLSSIDMLGAFIVEVKEEEGEYPQYIRL